jgi:hypothetical protein
MTRPGIEPVSCWKILTVLLRAGADHLLQVLFLLDFVARVEHYLEVIQERKNWLLPGDDSTRNRTGVLLGN